MYLECFLPDPYNDSSWTYDTPDQEALALQDGPVLRVSRLAPNQATVWGLNLSPSQLEAFAEEMIWHASKHKQLVPAAELEAYFGALPGGLTVGQTLSVKGVLVAIPPPEFLGRYCSNQSGKSNLVLFNPRAVVPVAS